MLNLIKVYFTVGGINVVFNCIGAMVYYYYSRLRGDAASKNEKEFVKGFDAPYA